MLYQWCLKFGNISFFYTCITSVFRNCKNFLRYSFLLQHLVTVNFDECGPSQLYLEKDKSKQQSLSVDGNTQVSSESNTRPSDTLNENLDCAKSDDDEEEERSSVVFNGDLRCEHGL